MNTSALATIGPMLTLWRRHEKTCAHAAKGRAWTRCQCPVWCDGMVGQTRIRQSLDTRDWGRAGRELAEMEQRSVEGRKERTVAEAAEAFITSVDVAESTLRKRRHILGCLAKHFPAPLAVEHISLDDLDGYRTWRAVSTYTWVKELELLRSFFGFCAQRKWCAENPAKMMRMPRDPKGRERTPYTPEQIGAILAAAERGGQEAYERLRWRAMLLLLRYYGLRISDVATLERSRVKPGRIAVRAIKNGRWLWMPLYDDVARALDLVPLPGGVQSPYFFWTGRGPRENHIRIVIDSLSQVYRASGVEHASSHRFRHTLAGELLTHGATIEQIADVLGDSPATIRKHYKHLMPEYQAGVSELLGRVHGRGAVEPERAWTVGMGDERKVRTV